MAPERASTRATVVRLGPDGPDDGGLAFLGNCESEELVAGFVIPKGLNCTWPMPETTRKYYAILDHSATRS